MSTGSERTPERCVHAPVGPDWAGLREPSSWKERALAAEEDARDTVAERNAVEEQRDALARAYDTLIEERDALRTQLDSMTVETRRSRVRADAPPLILKIVDERRLVSPWTVVEGEDVWEDPEPWKYPKSGARSAHKLAQTTAEYRPRTKEQFEAEGDS